MRSFRFSVLFVALVSAVAVTAATPPLAFKAVKTYPSGGYGAYATAVADVNGDGNQDLIVAGASCYQCGNGQVGVLLGNGDGTFHLAVIYSTGAYYNFSIAVADVNGDNHLDIVAAGACQNAPDPNCSGGGVSVLLGNGDGTFKPAVTYSSGGVGGDSIAIGDVNGDRHLDLVVANNCATTATCNGESDGEVSVLLGKGDGTFKAPVKYDSGGIYTTSVALADLNHDGRLDVVVANEGQCKPCSNNGGVSVLLNMGNGAFRAPITYSSGGYQGNQLTIGDVNDDGNLDVIVSNSCLTRGTCTSSIVSVLLGKGNGTLETAVPYGSGGLTAGPVAIADLNGDGKPDIIVANSCTSAAVSNCGSRMGAIGILLGNGDGTFQTAVKYTSGGYQLASLAVADVNGDGKPDLLAGNDCTGSNCNAASSLGTVGVLLNNFIAATTTAVTSSINPAAVDQSVTFTATISSVSQVPDGSTITFYSGTTQIGTEMTTVGIAKLTTSFASAKTYTIKAKYPGDIFHKTSSGTVKEVVSP